jgi:hypothetical protein
MKFSIIAGAVVMMALAGCAAQEPKVTSASTPYAATGNEMQLCGATFKRPVIDPAPPGTPPNVAAFLGQWGDGFQGWDSGASYSRVCGVVFVVSVNPDGAANVMQIVGPVNGRPARLVYSTLKIDASYMTGPRLRFWQDGAELHGDLTYELYIEHIDLPRVVRK